MPPYDGSCVPAPLGALNSEVRETRELALAFRQLMKKRAVSQFSAWLEQTDQSTVPEMRRFAVGLRSDSPSLRENPLFNGLHHTGKRRGDRSVVDGGWTEPILARRQRALSDLELGGTAIVDPNPIPIHSPAAPTDAARVAQLTT